MIKASDLGKYAGIALLVALLQAVPARGESVASTVRDFVNQSGVNGAVKKDLIACSEKYPGSTEWALEANGEVYALAVVRVVVLRDATNPHESEESFRKVALKKAVNASFVFVASEGYLKQDFSDRNAVTAAFLSLGVTFETKGELAKLKQTSNILNGVALSLVTVPKAELTLQEVSLPKPEQFRSPYCAALLQCTEYLMARKSYDEALPRLKEIISLQKDAGPAVYLDAAECFTKVGKRDDGVKILRSVQTNMTKRLTSSSAERLGDLLLEAGLENEAKQAFELASTKFQQEITNPRSMPAVSSQ